MYYPSMVLELDISTCKKKSNNKQDQKYQKMIYNSISVTKEYDNKMSDYNKIHLMGNKIFIT